MMGDAKVFVERRCLVCGRQLKYEPYNGKIQRCWHCKISYKPNTTTDKYGGVHTSYTTYTTYYDKDGVGWLLYLLEKKADEVH
jgi:hypothetical protein